MNTPKDSHMLKQLNEFNELLDDDKHCIFYTIKRLLQNVKSKEGFLLGKFYPYQIMKIIISVLFLALLLFFNNVFAQDTIHWSPGYKLKWEDFQGKADSSSQYGAISYPGIKYSLSANEDSFSTKVFCFFLKSKSWARIKNNDILLLHEQGHFDIAELFARKLRKSFAEYNFNYQTVGKDIDKIFILNKQERNKTDALYDKETNLSQNKKQQSIWNTKIKIELHKLKEYASS